MAAVTQEHHGLLGIEAIGAARQHAGAAHLQIHGAAAVLEGCAGPHPPGGIRELLPQQLTALTQLRGIEARAGLEQGDEGSVIAGIEGALQGLEQHG